MRLQRTSIEVISKGELLCTVGSIGLDTTGGVGGILRPWFFMHHWDAKNKLQLIDVWMPASCNDDFRCLPM